jgi:hypothetical protein
VGLAAEALRGARLGFAGAAAAGLAVRLGAAALVRFAGALAAGAAASALAAARLRGALAAAGFVSSGAAEAAAALVVRRRFGVAAGVSAMAFPSRDPIVTLLAPNERERNRVPVHLDLCANIRIGARFGPGLPGR